MTGRAWRRSPNDTALPYADADRRAGCPGSSGSGHPGDRPRARIPKRQFPRAYMESSSLKGASQPTSGIGGLARVDRFFRTTIQGCKPLKGQFPSFG